MKFGIIGAMDVEVATLKKNMQIMRTSTKASMEFCEGMIGDTAVVVVKCGIAKVNAGICVQILVDDFAVTHIINTGVAGSLDARINIGDIVISTDACYHDVDATVFGYRKGEVPQMGLREFPADEWLRTRVQASCRIADPDLAVFFAHLAKREDRNLKPLQQTAQAALVEGAAGKKLKPSLRANSSKASAIPSSVRPSWLNRSCDTTKWPCVSRINVPSGFLR